MVDDSINIAGVIIAPTGDTLGMVNGPSDFLKKYTTTGAIPRDAHISLINAYYLSHVAPLVIARACNSTVKGGVILSKGLVVTPAFFDENNDVIDHKSKTQYTLSIPLEADGSFKTFNYAIEDILMYHGELPDTLGNETLLEVNTINDVATVLSRLGGFYFTNYKTNQTDSALAFTSDVYSREAELHYGEVSTDVTVISDSTANTLAIDEIEDITEINEEEKICAFISNQVTTDNTVKGTIRNVSGKFLLKINSDNDEGSYTFSFDPMSSDSTGSSDYAEILNNLSLSFTTVIYENAKEAATGAPTTTTELEFGASLYSKDSSEAATYVSEALGRLVEQEVYKIDGLCLFGLQTTKEGSQIAKQFNVTGAENKWFLPIGVPWVYTNRRTIANWAVGLNLPEPNPVPGALLLGPFDKDTSLLGWVTYIDPGCKYWERVIANKSLSMEFAPVFKENTGAMNMANPCLILNKTDRNLLLNRVKAVNWITKNPRTLVHYLNQNWSWQQTSNVAEEEQIVRQIWKISRDCEPLLEQFFAKYNTRTTRTTVGDIIDYYFQWNIMNQEFAPQEYRCICDTTNNDDQTIRAHKLRVLLEVRYIGSIKWIEVINRAYPLGVDFNGEM